nr:phosphatase PAP2 family protein [Microbacterium bovistercoris]
MHTSSPRPALVAPLILAGAVLAVVIGAGFAIVGHPDWSVAEDQAIRAVQSVGGAGLELVAGAIGIGFGPAGAILVVLIVLAVAYLRTRSWRLTARTAIVIAVPWAVAEAIKDIVRRPRPDPALLGQAATTPLTYSFPSGHTAFAAALGCAVILLLATGRARAVAVAIAAVVVLLTGWSRIYLGAHYPTDVIASMILVPVLAVAADRVAGRIRLLADDGLPTHLPADAP